MAKEQIPQAVKEGRKRKRYNTHSTIPMTIWED